MPEITTVTIATAQRELTGNIVLANPEPFGEAGLRTRMVTPGTGPAIVDALLNGEAEYANVLAGPILAAVRGAPLKVILTYQNRGWELWAHPEIMTLPDLVGRTLAHTSPLVRRHVDALLRAQGIDPQTVRTGEPTSSPRAIIEGRVDAMLLLPPMTVEAARVGLRRILRLNEDLPTFGLVTTDARLREHPDEVARLVRATLRSIRQLREDRNVGIELVRDLGTPHELAEIALDETLEHLELSGEVARESQHQWIRIACEVAGVEASVPLAQVFDFGALHQVRSAMV